jgi:3-isopropylmalate/(R)-2-methylmalate dehydratase large subunit
LPQEGHALPGTVIFGTDSHTCTHGAFGAFATGIGNTDAAFVMGTGKLLIKVPETQRFTLYGSKPEYIMAKDIILKIIGDIGVNGATYCAMEFCGETISSISMEERMTLCNMAVEAGAKNGIIAPDKRTFDYIRTRAKTEFTPLYGNPDAHISKDISIDIPGLEPVVAKPHSPANIALARQLGNVKLDSAYIGSCTGGKITDFQAVARILQNNHVCINTYLVPATQEVADDLSRKQINGQSLVDIFKNAGCLDIAPPSCAACLGGPPDTFGRTHGKEVVISTTNRNFLGRMGSRDSLIYLASPLTVAASAIRGYITDPRDFL